MRNREIIRKESRRIVFVLIFIIIFSNKKVYFILHISLIAKIKTTNNYKSNIQTAEK